MLVAQDAREVELHRRAEGWRAQRIGEGSVPIDCLGVEVSLATIDEDVPDP